MSKALFPPDFLTRVEYLSIVSRRVFRGKLLAQHRTMQVGLGIEFADHREYLPGDDFRYLDWNIYARLGDLLLKRFQEEQDLHVYLMLDCSRSMSFGEPPKFDLARQLVAALAYLALADLDRVAVFAFAREVMAEFPLGRGKSRILPLMKFLEALPVTGADTDLGNSIQDMLRRTRRNGLVVVVSDLFDEHGYSRGLDQLRFRQCDGHVIQIYDPGESEPALRGDVELVDIESNAIRNVTVREKDLLQYQALFRQHQKEIREYCRRYAFGCVQTTSTVRFDDLILRMMRVTGKGTA